MRPFDLITRRSLIRLGGAALATAIAAPTIGGIARASGRDSRVKIVDTGHGTNETFLRGLASNGVETIFRYYAQEDNIPGKNITPRERDMIFAHGLSIAIVYQHEARLPGRFTPETGVRDANFCLGRAAEIGQPPGTAIFFGIDSDAHTTEEVLGYLVAVSQVLRGRYTVGCYGAGNHCAAAVASGVAMMSWVAEAPAWGGTRQFINSGGWHLYQNKTQIEDSPIMSAGGVPIDANILNPRFDTIGAFDRNGHRVVYDSEDLRLAYERRRFVAATQLNLRDRPDGRVIGHLCIARTVHILDADRDWAEVDINEDGRAEGYVAADYLVPLNQMPDYVSGCSVIGV